MTNKRDKIVLATRDLIFEKGLQDLSMSQIAERAEVGMGTIYNYFTGKDELVYCLYDKAKSTMSAFVMDGYDERQPVVVLFLHVLSRIVEYGVQYPREFRLSQQLAQVPFIQAQAETTEYPLAKAFEHLFSEAKNQRLLKDMPDPVMALFIAGALNALVEAHTTRQLQLDAALIDQAVAACWDAIKR
jgi:AcrR family transcriptional regulator